MKEREIVDYSPLSNPHQIATLPFQIIDDADLKLGAFVMYQKVVTIREEAAICAGSCPSSAVWICISMSASVHEDGVGYRKRIYDM